jgi:hypothetical protein
VRCRLGLILGCGKRLIRLRDVGSAVILGRMTSERILSPDGTQYWDGQAWRPADFETAAHASPQKSPQGTSQSAAGAAGALEAPTGVGVIPTGAPVAPSAGGPSVNAWVATKWAWLLALSPLLAGILIGPLMFVGAGETDVLTVGDLVFYVLGFATLVACTAACSADVKTLRRRGVQADQSFTAAVLLLYVVGAPSYLIYRTVKARSTPLIPITWFVAVLITVALPFVFLNEDGSPRNPFEPTTQFNVPGVEDDLAAELRDLGFPNAEVDCPDNEAYAEGDMVMCTVSNARGLASEVVLEIRNDGYYQWQVQ